MSSPAPALTVSLPCGAICDGPTITSAKSLPVTRSTPPAIEMNVVKFDGIRSSDPLKG